MSRNHVHPIVVNVAHAADLLDCSRPTIYALVERGELRRIQLAGSRSVRIPVADIYKVLGFETPSPVGLINQPVEQIEGGR